MTRLRGPFALALLAALLVAAGAIVAQTVIPRIQADNQARVAAQAAAQEVAYHARVKAVSDEFKRPASLPRDCPEWTDRSSGYFCWLGKGDPVELAVTLRDSLAKISSVPPSVRCWASSVARICVVKAEIDGKFLRATVMPPHAGSKDVRLDGAVLDWSPGDLPAAGTPIAIPD